jgi:hypothetical protein
MTVLRAIPQHILGCSFSSTLEARWGLFMNVLHIKFEYEPEGYDLDGLWYRPDFWIPSWDMFVEVKPDAKPKREDFEKMFRLSQLSKKPLLEVLGPPYDAKFIVITHAANKVQRFDFPIQCQHCGAFYLAEQRSRYHDLGLVNLTVKPGKKRQRIKTKPGFRTKCAVCNVPTKLSMFKIGPAAEYATSYKFGNRYHGTDAPE